MSAFSFPSLIPSKYKQKLEALEKESTDAQNDIKLLQLKRIQMHEQEYLAAKINFLVLIILSFIKLSPFGALISNECSGALMMISIAFTKSIINFFKPIKE